MKQHYRFPINTTYTLKNTKFSKAKLQALLDEHYYTYNHPNAISMQNPDPLLKVYEYKTHQNLAYIALICALFSYGNVRAILGFLAQLDFGILDSKEAILGYDFPYYRFQSSDDVKLLFASLYKLRKNGGIEDIMFKQQPLDSIYTMINTLHHTATQILSDKQQARHFSPLYLAKYKQNGFSQGFLFLVGNKISTSPLKRWNMFLRWMVRKDNIDLGIWNENIKPSSLLLPLDTHTFRISHILGLLQRKSYDIKAVLEVSASLAKFCRQDPIRYDFALYRIGQSRAFP